MKKFKSKLTVPVIIIATAILIASTVGIIINIINIANEKHSSIRLASFIALLVLCVFIFITAVLTFIISRYTVKNGFLIKRTGIFKEIIDLSLVFYVCKYTDKKTLVLYGENSYVILSVTEPDFDEFIKMIREENSQIIYDCKRTDENENK